MLLYNTLKVLAETSETAREAVAEWGFLSEKHVAFQVTPDGDDLHISMVDSPLCETAQSEHRAHGSITKIDNL